MRIAPSCAIMISSYEFCKRFFANYNLQQAERWRPEPEKELLVISDRVEV